MGRPHGEQPGWGQGQPSPWAPPPQGGWGPPQQPAGQAWPAPPVTDWARPPVEPPVWVPPVQPPPVQPPPVWQSAPPKPPRRRLWWVLGAAALALVVAAGVVVFLLVRGVGEPGEVIATVADDGVEVSWLAARSADSYEVFRGDELLIETTGTSWLDSDAPGGTEHHYSVVALGEDGDRSEPVDAPAVTAPLDAPALTAFAEDTYVILEWDPVTGADRYELERDGEVIDDDLVEGPYRDAGMSAGDHEYVLTAFDDDGEGGSADASASVFTQGPWQDAYEIALAFPELVSAEPGGQGWEGSTCNVSSGAGVAQLVVCEYPNGIYVEVLQFADTAQQDAKVEEYRAAGEPGSRTWASGDGADDGGLFINPAGNSVPWMFLTFWDTDLELFAVYADWEGHSYQELQDTWFASAPLISE